MVSNIDEAMKMKCAFLTSLSLMTVVCGATAKPSAAFGFTGPEIIKVDWTTRAMNVHDMDGDGLNDIVLVNNDRSVVELLIQTDAQSELNGKRSVGTQYWDPEIEDARYRRESVKVGYPIFDLCVGDFNRDGRQDLAFTAREVPLVVCYQTEDRGWTDRVEYDDFEAVGWTESIWAGDLDADGSDELVVIAADALRLYRQAPSGRLGEPSLFYVSGENPYNLMLCDVTDDTRLDVLYLTSSGEQSLAMREQMADGGFGAERRFVFDQPVRKIVPMPRAADAEPQSFAAVDSRSGGIEFFQLVAGRDASTAGDFADLQPEVTPMFKRGKGAVHFVYADLSGDGREDYLVSNPDKAELVYFGAERGARFAMPQQFPTLAGVSSMSAGRFFKQATEQVLVVSEAEQVLGMSLLDSAGRVSFPRRLDLDEGFQPLLCESTDIDGDGLAELFVLGEIDSTVELRIFEPVDRDDAFSAWRQLSGYSLGKLRRKPNELKILESGGDGVFHVMLFVPREAPLVVLGRQGEDGLTLEAYAENSSIRESLLKGLVPAQVSLFDVDGEDELELVVGRPGFARALALGDHDFEMVDQFNARRDDTVAAVLPIMEGDEVNRLLFVIEGSGEIQSIERAADGVFRYVSSERVGNLQLLDWRRMGPVDAAGGYLLAGSDRFWVIPKEGASWRLKASGSYETELKDVAFSHVQVAAFSGGSEPDLVAVDSSNHVVEILSPVEGDWKSQLYWKIFEQNMHYQGRTGGKLEPRQVVVSDFNGDGREDFAFLVHDRILFYLQD